MTSGCTVTPLQLNHRTTLAARGRASGRACEGLAVGRAPRRGNPRRGLLCAALPGRVIYPCPVMPEASARICGLAWSGGIYVANCSAYPMVADVRVWLEE